MFSCLLIRHFAAAVERHHHPSLRETPLLIATTSRVKRVVATSHLPRREGVQPKMTVKQALLLSPQAEVIPANEAAYQRVAEDMAGYLLRFTNKVEIEYQPTSTAFYLDTDTETDAIRHFIQRYLSVTGYIGIAANKFTARVAAAYAGCNSPIICIPTGQERDFLADRPVTLLPLTSDMIRRLPLLGIHTLGQLASLPRLAVWEQFGKVGKWLHVLANGSDLRPIQPYQPPKQVCAGQVFADGIADAINDRDVLQNALRRIAAELIDQLAGEEARRVSLLLYLADGSLVEAHTQPPTPIYDVLSLARRLHDLLNQQVIRAAVCSVEVHLAHIQAPQPQQLSLFDHLDDTKKLEKALPGWIALHHDTGFYYTDVLDDVAYALPEDRFILRQVLGA